MAPVACLWGCVLVGVGVCPWASVPAGRLRPSCASLFLCVCGAARRCAPSRWAAVRRGPPGRGQRRAGRGGAGPMEVQQLIPDLLGRVPRREEEAAEVRDRPGPAPPPIRVPRAPRRVPSPGPARPRARLRPGPEGGGPTRVAGRRGARPQRPEAARRARYSVAPTARRAPRAAPVERRVGAAPLTAAAIRLGGS